MKTGDIFKKKRSRYGSTLIYKDSMCYTFLRYLGDDEIGLILEITERFDDFPLIKSLVSNCSIGWINSNELEIIS